MSSVELEIQISELQNDLMNTKSALRFAETDCTKAEDKIVTARAKLKHHLNNKDHVQFTADLVNLEEYKSTLQSVENLEIEIENLEGELAVFVTNRTTLARSIKKTEKAIEKKRQALKAYGGVIKFPTK